MHIPYDLLDALRKAVEAYATDCNLCEPWDKCPTCLIEESRVIVAAIAIAEYCDEN